MDKRKKIIIPIIIVTIVVLLLGATFAYWRWQTQRNEEVNIALTFSGSSDDLYARIEGGEPITNADVTLLPTNNCLGNTALQRTVSITYKNATSQPAKIDAQMDVTAFQLQSGRTLTNDDLSHIHWAITTNSGSCSSDVVSQGDFQGITFTNSQISNMTNDSSYGNIYSLNSGNPMITISVPANTNNETTSSNYYAYVWIDEDYRYTNLGDEVTDPMSDFYLQLTWHGKIYQKIPGPNEPEVVEGLVPVKLSDSGDTVTTVSENDSTWYNYNQKKWANAVLVNEDTHTRSYYLNNPGTEIPQSDILAYYVWIPRYSYKVWQYEGVSATGSEQEINIKFINTSTIENATSNGDWYTHPAFWWDNDSDGIRDSGEELSGIWVGKFETSHTTLSSSTANNNLGCSSSNCTTYNGLRILPNVQSLRYNNVSNFYYASRAMETSGNDFGINPSTTDSHMMKNSEWGAVVYLSHSKYGINDKIRINNTYNITTGCGALNDNDSSTSTCNNAYKSVTTYPQSTTGNVTGIFDMSGGSSEYVMGTYNNDNSYGNSDSGFNSSTNPLPDSKYYDNYSNPPFDGNGRANIDKCTLTTCGGHALNETKSWYNNSTLSAYSSNPWFHRGGERTNGVGFFTSFYGKGNEYSYISFRLILAVE